MPICNLITSSVAPSTIGKPPLQNAAIVGGLNCSGSLKAILKLSFASETNSYASVVARIPEESFIVIPPDITITGRAVRCKSDVGRYEDPLIIPLPKNLLPAYLNTIRALSGVRNRSISSVRKPQIFVYPSTFLSTYNVSTESRVVIGTGGFSVFVGANSSNLQITCNVAKSTINTGLVLRPISSTLNTTTGSNKFVLIGALNGSTISCSCGLISPSLIRTVTVSSTPQITSTLISIATSTDRQVSLTSPASCIPTSSTTARLGMQHPLTSPASCIPTSSTTARLGMQHPLTSPASCIPALSLSAELSEISGPIQINSTPPITPTLSSITVGLRVEFSLTSLTGCTPRALSLSANLQRISPPPIVSLLSNPVLCSSLLPTGGYAAPLFVPGSNSNYFNQVQEYVRYPLPTATSVADALDENVLPVQYSHSVFGSMLLRLTPGYASSAGVSFSLFATQLGSSAAQYAVTPNYDAKIILLRTSTLDSQSVQQTVFGSLAVGPDVNRVAPYSSFPRSYNSSVASMGSGGSASLVSVSADVTGTYSAPTVPMLFMGSTLVRHNYNQAQSTLKPSAVATDYYYPETSAIKITKARVETTTGIYNEGLSPIYSSPAFRLLSPTEYLNYSASGANFSINAAVMAQDGTTNSPAHIHASDAMMTFLPIKTGARYAYSRYRPSALSLFATVADAGFEGEIGDISFSASFIDIDGGAVDPNELYSGDADCILRVSIIPYVHSELDSFIYIDIPVLGISTINPDRVIIDSSYRWFIEQCLIGGSFVNTHGVRSLKDFYNAPNNAPTLVTKAVLAVTRPIVNIATDQGESEQQKLSNSGDRNLLMGEFSVDISRQDLSFDTALKVNVDTASGSAISIYTSDSNPAVQASSFDPNSLHLFVKFDGTLGCRRVVSGYAGPQVLDNLDPILPKKVREFIDTGGLFSEVKVGESIIALLSQGVTGKKLFLWGYNTYGHLDVPAAVDANFLTQGYIENVKQFDFNAGHIAVILDNGKLYSWGNKKSSVWADPNISPVSNLDIGGDFSVAIVKRFNSANNGVINVIEQYGDCPPSVSVPTAGITVATRQEVWPCDPNGSCEAGEVVYAGKVLACGKGHVVLLKSDNTVVCWGDNDYGQSTVPSGLSNVIAVDAGDYHTIALKNDKTVVCWGRNNHGQTDVPGDLRAKSISAGGDFCVALRTAQSTDVSSSVGSINDEEIEDTAACWGRNNRGQCDVPTCEGISYDPTFHKYRMRFWAVYCGWDHTVGIRRDDVQSKWVTQHPEFNRFLFYNLIKIPLKTSSGQTIFDCLRRLIETYEPGSNPPVFDGIVSSTGAEYSFTPISGTNQYRTAEVSGGSRDYRLLYTASLPPTLVVQFRNTGSTDWQDLTFSRDVYNYEQNLISTDNFTDILVGLESGFDVGWNGIPVMPTWCVTVGCHSTGGGEGDDGCFLGMRIAKNGANNENITVNYITSDSSSPNLDQSWVAWGNPMAWDASVDKTKYSPYYPQSSALDISVSGDIVPANIRRSSSIILKNIFSYVGCGKQLGIGTSSFNTQYPVLNSLEANSGPLHTTMYLGPRSLEIIDTANNFLSITSSASGQSLDRYELGSFAIFISDLGLTRFFNIPTPVNAEAINLYATPEKNEDSITPPKYLNRDTLAIGFNNKSVYVERFKGILPSGYSIVSNGSSSLPSGTPNSASGYHLLFSGTVGGSSINLVMTGAYSSKYGAANSISIPFDPNYSSSSLNSAWLPDLGITIKRVRIIRHQLDAQAGNNGRKTYIPSKHVTVFRDQNSLKAYGLVISNSSEQRVDNIKSLYSMNLFSTPNAAVYVSKGNRSVIAVKNHNIHIENSYPYFTEWAGNNTKGQLDLNLFGPFAINPNQMLPGEYNSYWLMNYNQTNIGHTQLPGLGYGFKKVVCGSFHTLAIDEDGFVHAWGLNTAINPPVSSIMPWDPILFSKTGCGDYVPANLTGYFIKDSSLPLCEGESIGFVCNRAPCSWPAGSSNQDRNLQNGLFKYPKRPVDESGCMGNYLTNRAFFVSAAGLENTSVHLLSQAIFGITTTTLAGGFRFFIGLEHDDTNGARIYVDCYSSGRIYSQPLEVNPKIIYLGFSAGAGYGGFTTIRAKINTKDIVWDQGGSTTLGINCIPYDKFLNVFGDSDALIPTYNRSVKRSTQPVNPLTGDAVKASEIIAGDSFFLALYNSQTSGKMRGSLVVDHYNDEISIGFENAIAAGSIVPFLALSGPKNYFIALVDRTYIQANVTVPADSIYNGAQVASINYNFNSASPNFKIYLGQEEVSPYTDPLDYSDETVDSNPPFGRWPKVVFPGDPEFDVASPPDEVWGYRQIGITYSANQFQFSLGVGAPTVPSAAHVYPAYPVAKDTANPFLKMVTYDTVSRRLLPQSYEPETIPTSPSSIALGHSAAFAIKSDATIFSWGLNIFDQRSDIDNDNISSAIMIAANYNGALVLDNLHKVRVIGAPGVPICLESDAQPPSNLGNCIYVAVTNNGVFAAIKQGGQVVCWGCATGPYGSSLINPPTNLGNCTQISGGVQHFAALQTDGKVVCWGDNTNGQTAVPSAALSGVVKVVCGGYHTVALKSNGQVICWGANGYSQSTVPGSLGIGCLDIAAGLTHTVAIKSTGSLSAWGNIAGTPTTGSYVKLGTGLYSEYAVAVRSPETGGEMVAWGNFGNFNETAIPTTSSRRTLSFNPSTSTNVGPYKHVAISAPTQEEFNHAYANIPLSIRARNPNIIYTSAELAGLEHAIAVASGSNAYYAIKASTYGATQGSLVAWGFAGSDNALQVPTGSNFVSVHSRNRHAAARKVDNTVVCWGSNLNGQAVSPTGTYSRVACGDDFTVAINASTNKLAIWGSISSVPAPYSNIAFSTVSAGKAHVVGSALGDYSENTSSGVFKVFNGDALAFGNNNAGQCNVPGFSYSGSNMGFGVSVVAGGDFTVYELKTDGFQVFTEVDSIALLDDDRDISLFEGYFTHKYDMLCPAVLPSEHPWSVNPPVSSRTPQGESILSLAQPSTGFTQRLNTITNATNVPVALRRGGTKRTKLISASRYAYHTQDLGRHLYGAGYSVIVTDNPVVPEIIMFGGDLRSSGCAQDTYTPPAEALAIRNTPSLTPEDDIVQINTHRAQIYALKSTGDIINWGYEDVSNFYQVDSNKKQYFSLPDNSLRDILPRLTDYEDSNLAMSYISGIPGVTDSWSVDVSLDRYFNGQKTNIKRFSAVGKSSVYSIANPVHFAETFLAIDTWPGEAEFLDSQYILRIIPRGVACKVNSASMFALNLDSKLGIQRVFIDGANAGADMTQPADFLIASKQGTNFGSSTLTSYPPVRINTVVDSSQAISLTASASSTFTSPSFIKNSYGSSAKLEFVDTDGSIARTGGRVADVNPIDPSDIAQTKAWYKYENLPTTTGNSIASWTNSIAAETLSLAESNPNLQPNVVVFNTSFRGAQFDRDTSQIDRLAVAASVSESSFTYFLVYKKAFTTQQTHCVFGKYALPSATSPRVQGIGFSQGKPVLFIGQNHDIVNTSVGTTSPGIICGYFGGGTDRGIRVNGSTTINESINNSTSVPLNITVGYHLGGAIIGATGSAIFHDTNDIYAEVVVVESRLSNNDIEVIEGYLAHKFNLQGNLPPSHPYKTAPAAWDSVNSVYPAAFLEDPLMLLESNRLVGSSGQNQTWLGMFELNINHKSKRTSSDGTTVLDHHAPLLAEFGVTVGITKSFIVMPIVAIAHAAAGLTVDSVTNYLVGTAACSLNVVPAVSLKHRILSTALVNNNKSKVFAITMNPRVGLRGSIFSTLGVFGCGDYDFIYGCLGTSNLPPDLLVLSPGILSRQINAILVTSASIGRIIPLKFGLIKCQLQLATNTSNCICSLKSAIQGSCHGISVVKGATLSNTTTSLNTIAILSASNIKVCAPDFFVKSPSAPKINKTGNL